jgi:hypothetical protein
MMIRTGQDRALCRHTTIMPATMALLHTHGIDVIVTRLQRCNCGANIACKCPLHQCQTLQALMLEKWPIFGDPRGSPKC